MKGLGIARTLSRLSTRSNKIKSIQVVYSVAQYQPTRAYFNHAQSPLHSTMRAPSYISRTSLNFGSTSRLVKNVACSATFTAKDIPADLGVMVEGNPKLSEKEMDKLAEALYNDGIKVVQQAAMYLVQDDPNYDLNAGPPGALELSLVLCDDPYIRNLNREWRDKDSATDVLSFEMLDDDDDDFAFEDDDEEGEAFEDDDDTEDEESGEDIGEPAELLGDVVISLDTAARQAKERGHSLVDECRILLVHGVLHLLGFDHENDEEEAEEMAAAETAILKALGWKGQGLVAGSLDSDGDTRGSSSLKQAVAGKPLPKRKAKSDIKILALDMDGTLLDSSSNVLPSSVKAIKAAMDKGVTVMLATGKARPAAIIAMQKVGLAGPGLVVSPQGPGIFLQGLTVFGQQGQLITGGHLSPDVIESAFEYALTHDIPICGFLDDTCITVKMHPELEELHTRYYEPLATVFKTPRDISRHLESNTAGSRLRKLLFMTNADVVDNKLKPHWNSVLQANGTAETMQAVPEMLEVVPRGWNKWRGMQALLSHLNIPRDAYMAIGDGGNDLELVANAGVGVAMGNAVTAVKQAATLVVASNNDGGIAEAIERYIL